jgi:lipoprotein-releasing system permease protein
MILDSIPGVRSAAPYSAREGMIRFADNIEGVYIKGIDPASGDPGFAGRLTGGTDLTGLLRSAPLAGSGGPEQSAGSAGLAPVVLGKTLALRLGVSTGDTVVAFALSASTGFGAIEGSGSDGSATGGPTPGGPAIGGGSTARLKKFLVRGTFESGMAEYDETFAYTTLEAAGELLGLREMVTGFDVMVDDIAQADTIAGSIRRVLGYPHSARTVFSVYRNLFSWAELQKQLSPVLLGLIVVVAAANIIGTILMFVLEKSREIGVLKTIGAGAPMIRRVFLYQGLLIAAGGVALGNALALVLCWIQIQFRVMTIPADIYYMTHVPVLLDPLNFVAVSAVAMALAFVATLVPAAAAARLDPVRMFRFSA